jgi:hypothetical protein
MYVGIFAFAVNAEMLFKERVIVGGEMQEPKRYVIHISGQGEKWEVLRDNSIGYVVNCGGHHSACTLPKSEYRLCESPERWVDVTADCAFIPDSTAAEFCLEVQGKESFTGYRLRKVQVYGSPNDARRDDPQWAFIIEKREP